MRKRARHADEAADVNVTPLLDIVFIMLIFFIVTATFIREKGIDIKSPEDSEVEPVNPPPSMILSVGENGLVQIDGGRSVDPLSVKSVVEEFFARAPKGNILVSAAPESASGVAVVVMDQARQAAQPLGLVGNVSLTLQSEG